MCSVGFQAGENLSNHLVKEPKIIDHKLQQLPAYEVVCTFQRVGMEKAGDTLLPIV